MDNQYTKLRSLDVSKHIEKKGQLSYLSWAWAVDQLLQQDPLATWEYKEPVRFGETMMVFCAVSAFGKVMQAQLPVMDHKNKAISNPDAMAVNTAMQRCLAKAIALHGIGLYIYAGEDLPEAPAEPMLTVDQLQVIKDEAKAAGLTVDAICKAAKVKDLADIAATRYDALINWITEKRKAA